MYENEWIHYLFSKRYYWKISMKPGLKLRKSLLRNSIPPVSWKFRFFFSFLVLKTKLLKFLRGISVSKCIFLACLCLVLLLCHKSHAMTCMLWVEPSHRISLFWRLISSTCWWGFPSLTQAGVSSSRSVWQTNLLIV